MRYHCWPLRIASLLSLTLLAGRLTGLLREIKLAHTLGVSREADTAIIFLSLPDLLVNLLLSGGLSAVLVPRFRVLSIEESELLFRQVFVFVSAAFTVIASLVIVFPVEVFSLLAPGLDQTLGDISPMNMFLLASSMPLAAASGVTTAYLNSRECYLLPGCGTLIYNSGVFAGLVVGQTVEQPLTGLCLGIAAGSLVRVMSQCAAIPSSIWLGSYIYRGFKMVLARDFVVATLSASLLILVPVFLRASSSMLGDGLLSSFNYALKLVDLPSGIIFGSLSTVALTRFSELEAAGDFSSARAEAKVELLRSSLLASVLTIIGVWFAEPVASTIFRHGAMHDDSIVLITRLFQISLLGIPGIAFIGISTAALNAARCSHKVFTITIRCLLFLPFLAIPGYLSKSGELLMLGLVFFQATLGVALAKSAGLLSFRGILPSVSNLNQECKLSIIFVAATVCIDWVLQVSHLITYDWIRVGVALIGFCFAIVLPQNLGRPSNLRNSSGKPK